MLDSLEFHVGGDDKLWINFSWPSYNYWASYTSPLKVSLIVELNYTWLGSV